MFWISLRLSFLFVFISTVNGFAIQRRGIINHDAVVGFPQMVPNTTEGMSYLRFKPWLDVPHGCVPFPAVDFNGNTGLVLPGFAFFANKSVGGWIFMMGFITSVVEKILVRFMVVVVGIRGIMELCTHGTSILPF